MNPIMVLRVTGLLALFCAWTNADPIVPPKIPEPTFPDKSYSVRDFGATGDGTTNDTRAINAAIEKCNAEGGGTVNFPAGKYLVASVHLKSNTRLLLDKDAVITGAKDGYDPAEPNPFDKYQDFGHSHFHDSVMWGENLENFAIEGGTLNGGGTTQGDPRKPTTASATQPERHPGNKVIAIRTGRNLSFKNVTHETGGHFVYLLNDCQNITIANVVIKKSRDAIDLMGCRDVLVHDCNFTGCGDDTLGIKSDYALGKKITSENIYAWDNYFESGCNGVQFGSETAGDFRNVNCWNIRIGRAGEAGIGITSNDGGIIDGVDFRDFTIKNATCPIYMLITHRLRSGDPDKKVGTIRNVKISNVDITNVVGSKQSLGLTATISGVPDSKLENITLDNVKITYKGGSKKENAAITPPYPKDYSPKSLGPRPASGFYIRHVKDLTFKNVEFNFESADPLPALVLFDVDGFTLDNFKTPKFEGMETMKTDKVTNLKVRG